ncbi:MAG TPA: hypothetical protein VFY48_01885 [Solirubrobacterales bacterium]|nr:hypothetical protein [Solirubrobacterales bacterium]
MSSFIRLDEDWHVSSTFSNGTSTVRQTVHLAEARSLKKLCIVDKVSASTDWVGDLGEACRKAQRESAVEVSCGVEAEVTDTRGTLELPSSAGLADHIYVSHRRLPTPMGPMDLDEARGQIEVGLLCPARVTEWLVRASAAATMRDGSVVLTDPFHILAELGVDSERIHPAYLRCLAGALVKREASVELSERWKGPSPVIANYFLMAGVPVRAATGSVSAETVGRYVWCKRVASEVARTVSTQWRTERVLAL